MQHMVLMTINEPWPACPNPPYSPLCNSGAMRLYLGRLLLLRRGPPICVIIRNYFSKYSLEDLILILSRVIPKLVVCFPRYR